MPAASLTAAAKASYLDCSDRVSVGNLKAALAAFVTQAITSFPDAVVNNHPVGNWLAPIQSLSSGMSVSTTFTQVQLYQAANLLYRICWAGSAMQSAGLITGAQGTALLAAYNDNID